jgi:hypothetical protein
MLVASPRLEPRDSVVGDVVEQLWGQGATNFVPVKMLIVFKKKMRVIQNADEVAPAVTDAFDNVLATELEVEKLSVVQQLEVIQSTNILLVQTGTGSLTLGVLMAPGSVLIEVLEYVGMNHSVSSAGWFIWPSVPYIHVRSPLSHGDSRCVVLLRFALSGHC